MPALQEAKAAQGSTTVEEVLRVLASQHKADA